MDRKEKILSRIKKDGFGMEVGPSHSPLAPKKEGFNVDIIDAVDKEALIKRYKAHGIDVDKIEDVDYIWQGESYAELTGKKKHYDWIIASHVIEHVPSVIDFVLDCDQVLKDDGVLLLAVPDKRYCFDHFRPVTGIAKIIDSHLQKNNIHSPGSVAEFNLNFATKADAGAWAHPNNLSDDFKLVNSLQHTVQQMNQAINNDEYIDVHAWCFTPHSFRVMIQDLYDLGLIPFKEAEFIPSPGIAEFHIALSRNGTGHGKTRLEMLKQVMLEEKGLM